MLGVRCEIVHEGDHSVEIAYDSRIEVKMSLASEKTVCCVRRLL